MPLTGSASVLQAALAPAIQASCLAHPECGMTPGPALTAFAEALAAGIANVLLLHITANAVVVTAGSALAQTGVIT